MPTALGEVSAVVHAVCCGTEPYRREVCRAPGQGSGPRARK